MPLLVDFFTTRSPPIFFVTFVAFVAVAVLFVVEVPDFDFLPGRGGENAGRDRLCAAVLGVGAIIFSSIRLRAVRGDVESSVVTEWVGGNRVVSPVW